MASGHLTAALHHLRRLIHKQGASGADDRRLLERFIGERDEAAFEVLVWRHGPMVLAMGQRLLRNQHDAEDLLQATFLTLVRKAATIGKRESLGSWLYKVAYRIALRVRTRAARTSASTRPTEPASESVEVDQAIRSEVRPLLDAAIRQLPERYRAPIVLCYLQGKTNREAADQLGCPIGTVSSRLVRGRELLRKHLTRHGVTRWRWRASRVPPLSWLLPASRLSGSLPWRGAM
jgi:RNA polymerase sigma factor (sigma-70 family)